MIGLKKLLLGGGLLALGADQGYSALHKSLTDTYYGKDMSNQKHISPLQNLFGKAVVSDYGLPLMGAGISMGMYAKFSKPGGSVMHRAGMQLVLGSAGLIGGKLAQMGQDLEQSEASGLFNLAAITGIAGATYIGGSPSKGSIFKTLTIAGGAAIGTSAEGGLGGTLAGAAVGAGLVGIGHVGAKAVRSVRDLKQNSMIGKAIDSSVGGIARFGGKLTSVQELKKKAADLAQFPSVLGPILAGSIVGAGAGYFAAGQLKTIQPEYANQIIPSSGPTMPMDTYTAGLGLGMHKNRKRRRI